LFVLPERRGREGKGTARRCARKEEKKGGKHPSSTAASGKGCSGCARGKKGEKRKGVRLCTRKPQKKRGRESSLKARPEEKKKRKEKIYFPPSSGKKRNAPPPVNKEWC